MHTKIENSNGSIFISLNAIAQIASDVVSRCFGVVGLAQGKIDGIAKRLKGETTENGIRVFAAKEGLTIELSVISEYGVNIKEMSASIINNVKYSVENQTGFSVTQVRVNVDGIRI